MPESWLAHPAAQDPEHHWPRCLAVSCAIRGGRILRVRYAYPVSDGLAPYWALSNLVYNHFDGHWQATFEIDSEGHTADLVYSVVGSHCGRQMTSLERIETLIDNLLTLARTPRSDSLIKRFRGAMFSAF